MKKAFNSVKSYGAVNANNGEKDFSINYFNELGFASLSKNMKAFKTFGKLENFESGQKPVVKTLQTKTGTVSICICGNGIYCHVTPFEGKAFSRKTTVKKFRTLKSLLGKLLRKKDLVTSNMLQTRVCSTPVTL